VRLTESPSIDSDQGRDLVSHRRFHVQPGQHGDSENERVAF
jgi:hypothetical protein